MEPVSNVRIYGYEGSVFASGYSFRTSPPSEREFFEAERGGYYEDGSLKRACKLADTPKGSGEDNFLNGIIVQFDLNFSIKAWTEAERYHFFDFVSSMSTMHRLTKFDFDTAFNEYVTENTVREMKRLLAKYNSEPSVENKLALLYNCPTGLMLTARMTTNYRQLKTIYSQRKNHTLPEWRAFCKWIKTLPGAERLITTEEKKGILWNDNV